MLNFWSGLLGYSTAALFVAAIFLSGAPDGATQPPRDRQAAAEVPAAEAVHSPRQVELAAAEARFFDRVQRDLDGVSDIVSLAASGASAGDPQQTIIIDERQPDGRGLERGRVTAAAVNLRSGPSTGYDAIGAALQGDVLDYTGLRDGDWVEVYVPAMGRNAWMHGRYLARL